MSAEKIERLLKKAESEFIPVPRKSIKNVKENDLSKKLRSYDNIEIKYPFPIQCGVYINTNECGVNDTAATLATLPKIQQSFHVGFSGWHNFDIMAQRHSSGGLVCDINPENALFLHTVLKYVRRYESRDDFINKINRYIEKYCYEGQRTNKNLKSYQKKHCEKSIKFSINVSDEDPYVDHYSVLEEINLERKRETSWLYTDSSYAYIRELALNDKIVLITENICAQDTFNAIKNTLLGASIKIDTLYVSNISETIFSKEDRNNFLSTIKCLLTENNTILIDAKLLKSYQCPTQRCTSRQELEDTNTLENWFYSTGKKESIQSENLVITQFKKMSL